MDDLTLVGVHEDGEHLLLVSTGGQRFRMRVDEALRAAVRRDRARLGQIQNEMEGRLRPREIQSRIRSGESAEEVAESAGIPIEYVRRYEGPVLAERGFVAEQARKIVVRRGAGPGPGDQQTLDAVVTERLAQRDVDPAATTWDAWRAEDTVWTVQLAFPAGGRGREARWTYDPGLRHVAPADDEANWLMDREPEVQEQPAAQRRLASVRDGVFDVEATPSRPEPDDSAAVDLLETLRERRGRRPRPGSDTDDDADPVREAIDTMLGRPRRVDPAAGRNPAAHPAGQSAGQSAAPSDPPPPEGRPLPIGVPADRRASDVLVLPDSRVPASGPLEDPSTGDDDRSVGVGSPRRPVRKQRRPSVPSWDDIVFGQRRD